MGQEGDDRLPEWAGICLANAPAPMRMPLEALLLFDTRLARIAGTAKEPALAQIRMAWWREELGREHAAPPPDPLLRDLLVSWRDEPGALLALIDGWEASLGTGPMAKDDRRLFETGNGECFSALARMAGQIAHALAAEEHGRYWGRAKLASLGEKIADHPVPSLPRLSQDLRALAIVGGLSRRALLRGGAPLFGDRLSPLAALRLALVGV